MSDQSTSLCWRSGVRLCEPSPDLGARVVKMLVAGEACYSAALILAGAPTWAKRHARRLKRDAASLGLGEVDEAEVLQALDELSHAAFSEGGSRRDGVVRVMAYRETTTLSSSSL